MRASPSLFDNINADLQTSRLGLQNAVSQLASEKRVSTPSDDPVAFAQSIRLQASAAQIDRYTANGQTVTAQSQVADSALSLVVNLLTQAVSLGTQGAGVTGSQRGIFVQQGQAVLDSVVAQANTSYQGVAVFGGASGSGTPFVADSNDPTTIHYQGDTASGSVQVATTLSVDSGLRGDAIFANPQNSVFGSLHQLIGALTSGTTEDIAMAIQAVSGAIAQVGQARTTYASTTQQTSAVASSLAQDKVTISTQQSNLTDVDIAHAATALSQAELAQNATYAMAAKVLPQSLLTYLR